MSPVKFSESLDLDPICLFLDGHYIAPVNFSWIELDRMHPFYKHNYTKLIVIGLIVGLVAVFFATGLRQYLTLDVVKISQVRFQELYAHHPVTVMALFVVFYIPVIALNLPGATILGLAAGALFGTLTGMVMISFASTIGATLACLLSRYLLGEWVQNKFGDRLAKVNEGIRREGAFYLFSMRLIPVIPFFIINMVMGVTPMRLWTFYWVSQLGMLPGTAIYVNAGSQIAQLDSLGGIVSANLVVSLALLGLFPLITKKLLNAYRNRFGGNGGMAANSELQPAAPISPELRQAVDLIHTGCTDCGACKTQCAFLQDYGTPREILQRFDFSSPKNHKLAYECSLCNLCGAVCPEKLEPGDLFLAVRREAADQANKDLSPYRAILGYEKRGTSSLFSYYALPEGCDTVFFPGCTLPGTRPETTWQLFAHLQGSFPYMGIVLDCCTKPSHDLGRQAHFDSMFGEMAHYLVASGIRKVLVACPNCYKIFKQYGNGLEVQTVYEVLSAGDLPDGASGTGELVVHDPCPLRGETDIQDAVRSILSRMGLQVSEMKHRRQRTLCCGEGGSVGFVRRELARKWGRIRKMEAKDRTLVTYCAGCAGFLNRQVPTVHIVDVLFAPHKTLNGGVRVAGSPFTYINRLKLKRRFKRTLAPAIQRVRTHCADKIAQQADDACTFHDCKRMLCQKGMALGGIFALSTALFFVVQYFMYLLDSYLYSAEFHQMFLENNLKSGNIGLMADYFRELGPLRGFPNLLLAHTIQDVFIPFGQPVVVKAIVSAFGLVFGMGLNLLVYLITVWCIFGLGRFLFGEILPMLRNTKAPLTAWMYPLIGLATAVPVIPVILPVAIGAVTRVRFKSFTILMILSLIVRVIWELRLPVGS